MSFSWHVVPHLLATSYWGEPTSDEPFLHPGTPGPAPGQPHRWANLPQAEQPFRQSAASLRRCNFPSHTSPASILRGCQRGVLVSTAASFQHWVLARLGWACRNSWPRINGGFTGNPVGFTSQWSFDRLLLGAGKKTLVCLRAPGRNSRTKEGRRRETHLCNNTQVRR